MKRILLLLILLLSSPVYAQQARPTNAREYILGGVKLTGVRFPHVGTAATLGSGAFPHNDAVEGVTAYTPAAGKRAAILRMTVSNQDPNTLEAGSSSSFAEHKTAGGAYHRLCNAVVAAAGSSSSSTTIGFILEAGEKISCNCDIADCAVWFSIIEFDATAPLRTVYQPTYVLSTNTTVYTVPTAKTAYILDANFSTTTTALGVNYTNESGGTRQVQIYFVTSGGSASTANLLFSGSVTNNTRWAVTNVSPIASLAAGDFIVFKTNLATDVSNRQMVWVNVVEAP